MGIFNFLKKDGEGTDPDVAIIQGLRSLEPALASSFSQYVLNQKQLEVLSREATQQYSLVKNKDRNIQTREVERFFLATYDLLVEQRKIIVSMQAVAKKRRLKMWRPLLGVVDKAKYSELVLKRIVEAHDDPAVNRLQGMKEVLVCHSSMERAELWPVLQ